MTRDEQILSELRRAIIAGALLEMPLADKALILGPIGRAIQILESPALDEKVASL